jgi:hypothetical protein
MASPLYPPNKTGYEAAKLLARARQAEKFPPASLASIDFFVDNMN